MNELKKVEINCETGEVIEIPYTDAEMVEVLAQREIEVAKNLEEKAKLEAEKQAKDAVRASAIAKLSALGLTEEEAIAVAGN